MPKRSFTITMEQDLQTEIDRVAAREDRSRNYVINTLCRIFLSQGAMHPSVKPENHHPQTALSAPLTPPPHTPPSPPPTPPPPAVPSPTQNTAPPPPKTQPRKR